MKKSIVLLFAVIAGVLNLFAQTSGCETVPTNIEGTASITFIRYPHKELTGGAFSVSATKQVRFASGNLQYKASTNVWRFALNQWDVIGAGNNNVSATYDGFIDLFGFGTSGADLGQVAYQPYSISTNDADYYVNNIASSEADWARHNSIVNGGDETGPGAYQWRVLTRDEWNYVLNSRTDATSLRGLGALMGHNGLYFLPDGWDWETVDPGATLRTAAGFAWTANSSSYSNNVIANSEAGRALWRRMEQFAAVFLPAAGLRNGQSLSYVNNQLYYWSSTASGSVGCYLLFSRDGATNSLVRKGRFLGSSVRPVQDVK